MKGERGDSGLKGEKGEPGGGFYDPRFGAGQGPPGNPGLPVRIDRSFWTQPELSTYKLYIWMVYIFSRDLKETQSEVPLDRRVHQEHLGLVMMVVQETQDLLDPLALQGHRHCQEPTDHVR